MLEEIAKDLLEELSYSDSLHINHIRVNPTYKSAVIELLLNTGRIVLLDNGTICLPSPD